MIKTQMKAIQLHQNQNRGQQGKEDCLENFLTFLYRKYLDISSQKST